MLRVVDGAVDGSLGVRRTVGVCVVDYDALVGVVRVRRILFLDGVVVVMVEVDRNVSNVCGHAGNKIR